VLVAEYDSYHHAPPMRSATASASNLLFDEPPSYPSQARPDQTTRLTRILGVQHGDGRRAPSKPHDDDPRNALHVLEEAGLAREDWAHGSGSVLL
jgi:hypothetical protein